MTFTQARPREVPRAARHVQAFPRIARGVVVVEAESARIVAGMADGLWQETLLRPRGASERGYRDWPALMNVVYQSHMSADNGRHFDALAQALAVLIEVCEVDALVLAGTGHLVAAFRAHVPAFVCERIAGIVPGTLHDPAVALLDRARRVLARRRQARVPPAYDGGHSGDPRGAVASGTGGSRDD